MKTLIEIEVNGKPTDAIVESWMQPKREDGGKIIWAIESDGIAKMRSGAQSVMIYAKNEAGDITPISIRCYSIKKLYQLITEIEQQEGEEFID